MRNITIRKQKGFTAVELIGAVVVIAILVAGLSALLSRVQNSANAQVDLQNVLGLKSCIGTSLMGTNDYAFVDNGFVIGTGCVPSNMLSPNNSLRLTGSTGNSVDIGSATFLTEPDRAIQVSYNNVSSDICYNLTHAAAPSFARIEVNQQIIKDENGTATYSPSVVKDRCSQPSNTINFVFAGV